MRSPKTPLFAALTILILAPLLATPAAAQRQAVPIPQIDWGWEMLEMRAELQRRSADRFDVFYGFGFSDQLAASGITFTHRSTADSGKYYQPNHYDHGNGVVAADVNGDRRLDLYFVNQLGANGLWLNQGGGRFTDATEEAGVAFADRLGATASFADVDNDGDPDLYVTSVRGGNSLMLNDGRGKFTDATAAAGLTYSGHSSAAVFFDYDRDGWLDLFLTNVGVYTLDQRSTAGYWVGIPAGGGEKDAFSGHLVPERTETSILYRNLGGGKFEDVSARTGLVDGSWSGDAAFADLNGDGFQDLYVLNMQGDDHYYENQGGERFVDKTAALFPTTPWGSMGVKFFDHDNDGRLDLLLTDMHSDMSRKVTPGFEKAKSLMTWSEETLQGGDNNIFGNAFYVNGGDGSWSERSDELGLENYWPWGVSVDDLNADGWDDVMITSSMNFPYRYGVNSVLLNNRGGGFLDSEFLLGVEPRSILTSRPWYNPQRPDWVTKKPWFDLDCAQEERHPLCRGRSDEFTVLANVGSRSAVLIDLDDDGDLDIVTNEFNDVPQLLISDLAAQRPIRFLKVRLIGGESNRDGLGAVVRVTAGGRTLTKAHDGKSGYLSQSSMPLYFGLGDSSEIDRVEISWPSGRTQTVSDGLAINTLLEVEEPAS